MSRRRRNTRRKNLPHPRIGSSRSRPEELNSVDYDTRQRDLEPAYEPEDEHAGPPHHRSATHRAARRRRRRKRNMKETPAALLWRHGATSRGADHPRRRGGDDILAVVRDHRTLPIRQPYRIEAADPGRPRDAVSAAQILGSRSAGAKRRAGARRVGAECADGAGGGAAHRSLRGGPERSAGPTLCRLGHLAHGDSVAGPLGSRPSLRCARTWKSRNAE